jgi:hypothetical protein
MTPQLGLAASESWIGAVAPVSLNLAVSDEAGMFITHLTVYPEGFHIHLTVLTRNDPGLVCSKALEASRLQGIDSEDLYLRLGVEFSDGRKAAAQMRWISVHGGRPLQRTSPSQLPPSATNDLVLRAGGREIADCRFSARAWVWPLPTSGHFFMHGAWAAAGLDAGTVSVPVNLVRQSASKARSLWSEIA